MHDAFPLSRHPAAAPPRDAAADPDAPPTALPLPAGALDRLMLEARARRARHLGAAFLVWPLLALAALVLIACLA